MNDNTASKDTSDRASGRPDSSLDGLPVLRLAGSAREIGEQYGTLARTRILRGHEAYAGVYDHAAGWKWDQARAHAESFVEPIEAFSPRSMDQIRGIAAGSGLDALDVLAMNLRTEILYAGKARAARSELSQRPGECTVFTFLESDGRRIVAQNWDWVPFAADTVVLLEVEPDDGPAYATIVEAGLLAKFGLNELGVAVATNALVSSADVGTPAVPYHVMLHALLSSRDAAGARAMLAGTQRSSSANYLVADRTGTAFDAETRPGGEESITWTDAGATELVHTNHFSDTREMPLGIADLGPHVMPDSAHRYRRATGSVTAPPGRNGRHTAKALMIDHDGFPDSICCHPNARDHPLDRGMTVAAALIDPVGLSMEIAVGNPCEDRWHVRDYRARWQNRAVPARV